MLALKSGLNFLYTYSLLLFQIEDTKRFRLLKSDNNVNLCILYLHFLDKQEIWQGKVSYHECDGSEIRF